MAKNIHGAETVQKWCNFESGGIKLYRFFTVLGWFFRGQIRAKAQTFTEANEGNEEKRVLKITKSYQKLPKVT